MPNFNGTEYSDADVLWYCGTTVEECMTLADHQRYHQMTRDMVCHLNALSAGFIVNWEITDANLDGTYNIEIEYANGTIVTRILQNTDTRLTNPRPTDTDNNGLIDQVVWDVVDSEGNVIGQEIEPVVENVGATIVDGGSNLADAADPQNVIINPLLNCDGSIINILQEKLATCGSRDFYYTESIPIGESRIIFPSVNDLVCDSPTVNVLGGSEINVVVQINPDGTHRVTPSADSCPDGWSYQYQTDCGLDSYTSTVFGSVDPTLKEFVIATTVATNPSFSIELNTAPNQVDIEIDWGDGAIETFTTGPGSGLASHTYATPYSGNITISYPSCADITLFGATSFATDLHVHGDFEAFMAQVPRLKTLRLASAEFTGVLQDGIRSTSDLEELKLAPGGGFTISGDLGSALSLAPKMNILWLWGQNTLSGNINGLNASSQIKEFWINGQNTLYGDIEGITNCPLLDNFTIGGQNTLFGMIDQAITSLESIIDFRVSGQNTISGDIGLMILGSNMLLKRIELSGANTLFGDCEEIKNLPSLLNFLVSGSNTISGNIGAGMLPLALVQVLDITGQNTVSGNIDDVTAGGSTPSRVTITGQNTVGGDIAGFATVGDVGSLTIGGQNIIFGDVGIGITASTNNVRMIIDGNNTINVATTPVMANGSYRVFRIQSLVNSISQADVDRALSGGASASWFTGAGNSFSLAALNAAPSAAGVADALIIAGFGVAVSTN